MQSIREEGVTPRRGGLTPFRLSIAETPDFERAKAAETLSKMPLLDARDFQIEHKQGDGDSKYAITERLQTSCPPSF